LVGRPPGHVESPYLLTGLLRCAGCGGSINVSRKPTRGREALYYVCATFRTRGAAKCTHGIHARLEPLDAAILGVLERKVLTEDVIAEVVERNVARYAAQAEQS